jgi:hypothetical protein
MYGTLDLGFDWFTCLDQDVQKENPKVWKSPDLVLEEQARCQHFVSKATVNRGGGELQ